MPAHANSAGRNPTRQNTGRAGERLRQANKSNLVGRRLHGKKTRHDANKNAITRSRTVFHRSQNTGTRQCSKSYTEQFFKKRASSRVPSRLRAKKTGTRQCKGEKRKAKRSRRAPGKNFGSQDFFRNSVSCFFAEAWAENPLDRLRAN